MPYVASPTCSRENQCALQGDHSGLGLQFFDFDSVQQLQMCQNRQYGRIRKTKSTTCSPRPDWSLCTLERIHRAVVHKKLSVFLSTSLAEVIGTAISINHCTRANNLLAMRHEEEMRDNDSAPHPVALYICFPAQACYKTFLKAEG